LSLLLLLLMGIPLLLLLTETIQYCKKEKKETFEDSPV
jgi:hypothetical protein